MRKLGILSAAFALVAVSFYGCDETTTTEPTATSTETEPPLFKPDKPLVGLFVRCYDPTGPVTYCGEDGSNYYTSGLPSDISYNVCPAYSGSIVLYDCRTSGLVWHPVSFCESGIVRWKRRHLIEKVGRYGSCGATLFVTDGTPTGMGYKLLFKPGNSGFGRESVSFTVYSGTAP